MLAATLGGMSASRLVLVLWVLVCIPGLGRAQAREEAPAGEDAWSPYPEAGEAPAAPSGMEVPFEPLGYPGASAAGEAPAGDDLAPMPESSSAPLPSLAGEAPPMPIPHAPEEAPAEPTGHASEGMTFIPGSHVAKDVPSGPSDDSARDVPSGPIHDSAKDAPTASSRDFARHASTGPRLLPAESAPRLSPRLMPEPLAVPLLRSVLDAAGASAATLGGAVLMELLTGTRCLRTQERMCILTSFLVTMLSISATAPVGAWAVGSLLGGEGKLWAAYLGSAMGMGLGVVGTMPTIAFGSGVVLAVAGPIGAVLGAAIGYEISHRLSRRKTPLFAERPSDVRMTPMLGATPGGSLVGGLAGSF